MYGYEAMADALAKEGVECVFHVSAYDNIRLLIELKDKKGVRLIAARRESGAAGMADGYSRVTGKPGVCSVTVGPGLTNAATALTTASVHKSPLICLTTEVSVFDRRAFKGKGLNQRQFAEAVGTRYVRIRHAETMAEDIQLAFRHVRSGGGPVVLAVPEEIMKSVLNMDWEYSPAITRMPPRQRSYPDPQLIAKAVDMLLAAKEPAILAGRGASQSHAEQEIISLAERTGALIAVTLLARGYLASHPYNVGIAGPFASEAVHSLLSRSDCVLAVGCGLNNYTTEMGLLFAEAQIIHIDQNPAIIGAITPVALGIVGDARASLAAINAEMDRRHSREKRDLWNSEVKSVTLSSRSVSQSSYIEAPDTIDPRELVAEMDRVLPRERILVLDAGHFMSFPAGTISVPDPSCLVLTLDSGSVGMGLYQGVGAAIGRPDRHVVVFTGDGGLMMTIEELDTAVRHGIPMTIVVMNDNAFGAEVHLMEAEGRSVDVALYDNPNFANVATALGAVGLTVRNANDIRALAERIGKGSQPVLIDGKVNRNVVHEVFQEFSLGILSDVKKK